MATGRYFWVVLGWPLEHTQSVLDGCDGELARVSFQQSKLGAWLDTFVDDVLNVVIDGVGRGSASGGPARAAGRWASAWPAAAMLVLSNLIIMRDMRRQRATGDLMDMVWWFSGGRKLGESTATPGQARASGRSCSASAGATRRIFLWLIFALLNQFVLVLIMAAIIALAWFVASVVQLIVRPAPAGH